MITKQNLNEICICINFRAGGQYLNNNRKYFKNYFILREFTILCALIMNRANKILMKAYIVFECHNKKINSMWLTRLYFQMQYKLHTKEFQVKNKTK